MAKTITLSDEEWAAAQDRYGVEDPTSRLQEEMHKAFYGQGKPGERHGNDRVEQWIAKEKRGETVTFDDVAELCPYQTVFVPSDIEDAVGLNPDGAFAILGFTPKDFSDRMRDAIVTELRKGKIIRLISNRAELCDLAQREVLLALAGAGRAH